jgi:ribosomal protein S18 acetylase RimI-like enzyme
MQDIGHILTLEDISNRMWSAEERLEYDGWVLQCAGGYTRRPNSVSILSSSCLPINEKVAFCEAHYAQRNLPTIFKIVPPLGLDNTEAVLDAHGYERDQVNSVQTLALANASEAEGTFYDEFRDEWMQAFARMKHLSPTHITAHAKILGRIPFPCCYAFVRRENDIVGVALGVCGEGYYGVFDVVTDERWRGQGIAKEVMMTLLAQGKAMGAHTAFLQMSRDNVSAFRLYAGLGFQESYPYVYRVRDSAR